MFLKDIHIGKFLKERVEELEIESSRLSDFLNMSEEEVLKSYEEKTISTELLLRWSKILEYDFFRLYSGHLVFYSPQRVDLTNLAKKESSLPTFRKNIYTKEIINFIIQQILTNEKTKREVIKEYNIPKNTLYRWLHKYSNIENNEKWT
ncbi:transposase [Myroides odoratus]|uniref:transposase n=1 Tax=Myroides odoratus TaxID=256 RepID=UPI000765E24D|nr:transposase [Myroides odoratus]